MKSRLMLLLPLGFALASCAKPTEVECVEYPGEKSPKCEGNPQAPEVTLNTQSMLVKPECVRAKVGSTITFRLTPKGANDAGSVKIFPKNPAEKWLNGTNSPDQDEIEIYVDDKLKKGERKYGFRTAKKCVDPRVAVED